MKKNNAGITLVSLVITVIVLLILSSIAVYSGVSTIRSARLTKFTTELKMMQQKVNELYDNYINNKSVTVNGVEYVGQGEYTTQNTEDGQTQTVQTKLGIQDIGEDPEGLFNSNRLEEVFSAEGSGITDRTGYMYYDLETIQALGLDDMEYEFFVNVATRSVVSIEGFNDYGTRYYTLDQVPNGLYNVDFTGTYNGNEIDEGLTFTVTSEIKNGQGKLNITNISYDQYVNKWQVRYRLKAEEGQTENTWYTTEEFTGTEYTIDVPIETLLKDYEIQIIHGEEIISNIQIAYVLHIGDYVNYDEQTGATQTSYTSTTDRSGYTEDQVFNLASYQYGWRVLGVDESTGEILLVSEDFIGPDSGGQEENGRTYYYLRGQTGYVNGQSELNTISKLYGQGNGASGTRSITIEDINKITGYDPTNTGNGSVYGAGDIDEYGNEVTYTNNGSRIEYSGTNGVSNPTSDYDTFTYYDERSGEWKTLGSGESVTLDSNYYWYYPNTLTTSSSGTTVGIETNSTAYEMLFTNSTDSAISSSYQGTTTGCWYWFASPYFYAYSDYADFGLRRVYTGIVYINYLFHSYGVNGSNYSGVRPVVSLKSDISISGGDGTSAETAYQIQ